MTYRYLLFDLDHTLLDFDASQALALEAFCQAHDLDYSDQILADYHAHSHRLWHQLELGQLTLDQLLDRRFKEFFQPHLDHLDGRSLDDQYRDLLVVHNQIFPGADRLLQDLKSAGYQLVAATNGVSDTQRKRLAQVQWLDLFDLLAISGELGHSKPDPGFYQAIYKMTGVDDTSAYLMIGDRLQSDMLGAHQAGIDSLWYNPHQAAAPSDLPLTYVVQDYAGIRKVLL